MTRTLTALLARIHDRCAYTGKMLDFIQIDGHFSARAKVLQSQGINSIQGVKQRDEYRDLIMQRELQLVVMDYVLCKHRFARRRYNKLIKQVYAELNKLEAQTKLDTVVKE